MGGPRTGASSLLSHLHHRSVNPWNLSTDGVAWIDGSMVDRDPMYGCPQFQWVSFPVAFEAVVTSLGQVHRKRSARVRCRAMYRVGPPNESPDARIGSKPGRSNTRRIVISARSMSKSMPGIITSLESRASSLAERREEVPVLLGFTPRSCLRGRKPIDRTPGMTSRAICEPLSNPHLFSAT